MFIVALFPLQFCIVNSVCTLIPFFPFCSTSTSTQVLFTVAVTVLFEAIEELLGELRSKTPEEIFFQDFKKFEVNGVTFGVGQISSMATEELFEIADRLKPYMTTAREEQGVDMIFFMLTSILDESTNLIFTGEKAGELVEKAYQVSCQEGDYYKLEGVVSRKKQLIPSFMGVLQ